MIRARQAVWLLFAAAIFASDTPSGARVSGRVTAGDGRPLLSAAVTMAPQDHGPVRRPESATISPDGRFSFVDVAPGRYEIRARGETQGAGPTLFGTFALAVERRDVSNVEVTLREGATLQGRVIVDRTRGMRPPQLSSLVVRAPLTDGSGFGDALTGRVRRDVTDAPFAADEGQRFDDVRVAITDAVTRVSIQVSDEKGPAADVPVAVFAASAELWIRGGRRIRLVRTDAAGNATIVALPPGTYLASAGRAIDERATATPQALEQLQDRATPFTVAPGATDTRVALRLDEGPAAPK